MSIIFFSSNKPESYKTDKWRHVFSQWYNSGKIFYGKDGIHDLSAHINKNDWNTFVINKEFHLREQWMMYLKALVFAKDNNREVNLKIATQIMQTINPFTIKALGRKVQGYDDVIWNKCKFEIVVNGNYLEFTQNKEMNVILKNTLNKEIAEASAKDNIWGIGYYENTAMTVSKDKWGQNLLGKAIMEVRDYLEKHQ